MSAIYWKGVKISTINKEESKMLQILSPFWGLLFEPTDGEIREGLAHYNVSISGITTANYNQLHHALEHTGLNLQKETSQAADLHVTIQADHAISYPISITINNTTYNLRQPSTKNKELHSKIYNGIWLPAKGSSIVIRFHPNSKRESVKWISYLLIQAFLRTSLKPLYKVSLTDYRKIAAKTIHQINPLFAQNQAIQKVPDSEWPELAHVPAHLQEDVPASAKSKEENIIQPFHSKKDNSDTLAFNPFKFQNKSNRTSIINPFKGR
ncbi:hypothetical protein [Guptibacillus hwajinpoensis]|uniref:Uncharacterized protein n=1 Tax=Guptibacillus hwajinpoensis TaxID=208199 RepID=A0ABU0K1Y7_9BACL|nr:hypothetical protein [Alkalihalobacillus hemicentroti]MDQ0483373.1 hypothetical protein [Alkalihalobacillus hemicentroti]